MKKIRKLTLAQFALLALAAAFAILASPQPAHANPPTCVQECTPGWNGCGSINGFTCYRSWGPRAPGAGPAPARQMPMSRNEQRYLFFFAAAIAVGCLWGFSQFGRRSPNPALGREIPRFSPPLATIPGNGNARRWLAARFIQLRSVRDFGRVAWEGGDLAILSAKDHRLRLYSPAGRLIGPPAGRGAPSDANGGLPTDFAITARGKLLFADANAPRGSGQAQLARGDRGLAIRAMGLATAPSLLLLMLPPSSPFMFAAVSLPGGQEKRFGRLFDQQGADGVETFGDIAAAPGLDRLYYAATYVGIMGGWTTGGQLLFLRRTVAALPPPELVRVVGGERITFDAPYSCLDLCYSADKLYVLTSVPPGVKLPASVLDEYSAASGDYLGSVRLPEHCGQFAIRGDLLATSSIHGTTIWKLATQ